MEEVEAFVVELVAMAVGAEGVFGDGKQENAEHDDLEDDTGNHEVGAQIKGGRTRVGGGSQTSTGSLEAERDDVAGDEDVGIPGGPEPGPLLANVDDYVLEGEIDTGGHESRRNDEQGDLKLEADAGKGIIVEHDSADIAHDLEQAAKAEGDLQVMLELEGVGRGVGSLPYTSRSCT